MTTKEQLEKLVLGNRFIQSPRLQKLYKELLDRLEAENKQCDINGVSRSKQKETLDNLLDITGLLKEAEAEADNGIYDPIEECANIIIDKYEIIKK